MAILRASERFAHPLRRSRAVKRVESDVVPGQVLFLCKGNICRSPFAEAMFARFLPHVPTPGFTTDSAGFIGPDRACPAQAIAAAERLGIDLSAHRSKLFTADMIHASKLVVVMSAEQSAGIRSRFGDSAPPMLVLGDLDPLPIEARTIADPWNRDDAVFDESYARIKRCVLELIRVLSRTPELARK